MKSKSKRLLMLIFSIVMVLSVSLVGCSNAPEDTSNYKKWDNCKLVKKHYLPEYYLQFSKDGSSLTFFVDSNTYNSYSVNSNYDITYKIESTVPELIYIDIAKKANEKEKCNQIKEKRSSN